MKATIDTCLQLFVDLGRTDFAAFDWRALFEVSEYQNDGKRSVDTIEYPALMKFVFEEMARNKQPIVIFTHKPDDIDNLLTELLTPECYNRIAVLNNIADSKNITQDLLRNLVKDNIAHCYVGEVGKVEMPTQFINFKAFITSTFVSEDSISKRVDDFAEANLNNEYAAFLCLIAVKELVLLGVINVGSSIKPPLTSLLFSIYNLFNFNYKIFNCRSLLDVVNIIETLPHNSSLREDFSEVQKEINSDLQKMINGFASKPIADIKQYQHIRQQIQTLSAEANLDKFDPVVVFQANLSAIILEANLMQKAGFPGQPYFSRLQTMFTASRNNTDQLCNESSQHVEYAADKLKKSFQAIKNYAPYKDMDAKVAGNLALSLKQSLYYLSCNPNLTATAKENLTGLMAEIKQHYRASTFSPLSCSFS